MPILLINPFGQESAMLCDLGLDSIDNSLWQARS